jgi:haloacetate dehalogenase
MMPTMPLEAFTTRRIDVGPVAIACEVGGSGPPLLLLHGYPQTRAMWRDVAPRLAEGFTVVAADLRGYGDSDAPAGDARHERYAKRAMAADQVALMRELGFERFAVAGHDRGGRVVHRMCRDSPDAVSAAAVLDIVPTKHLFDRTDMAFASAYYHWFFLSQPANLPERLIGADPAYFVSTTLDRWSGPDFTFSDDVRAEYVAAFTPAVIHASCEDYRAAASVDLEHDAADANRIACPLLVAWGTLGAMHRLYDVPATWRAVATTITSAPVTSGHFLPEEAPDATAEALLAFFQEHVR